MGFEASFVVHAVQYGGGGRRQETLTWPASLDDCSISDQPSRGNRVTSQCPCMQNSMSIQSELRLELHMFTDDADLNLLRSRICRSFNIILTTATDACGPKHGIDAPEACPPHGSSIGLHTPSRCHQ